MFGLFKTKNPYEQPARALYRAAMAQARDPVFFREYGVPDSVDGRFDLLLAHLFLLIHRCVLNNDRQLSQALFDATFAHMDQDLRQAGIGDMGVPKHMRRMMKAFNGRMQAYEQALKEENLEEILRRNLYGTLENLPPTVVSRMAQYIKQSADYLAWQDFAEMQAGRVAFLSPPEARKYGT